MSDKQETSFGKGAPMSIRHLRERFNFEAPEHQRGFAQGEAQWSDLWRAAMHTSRREHSEHFSGEESSCE